MSGYFVCFFKQKTAYEMRISDWSSDVCSSDLRQADQRDEYCEPAQRSRQDPSDAALITVSRTSEPVVESSKEATGSTREPVLLALVFGYVRLEKSRAQRGRERQRQQRREPDRDGQRDGKLSIDSAGRTRSEERRVGKEYDRTVRYGCSWAH